MKQKLITACVLSWLFLYPLSWLPLLLMAVATDPAQEPRVESQYTVCDLLEAIERWHADTGKLPSFEELEKVCKQIRRTRVKDRKILEEKMKREKYQRLLAQGCGRI